MTTEQSTGLDIEAMAREAGFDVVPGADGTAPIIIGTEATYDIEDISGKLGAFAALILDRAASIAERMGLDAQSDEAKRLAVEIVAAIRAEVG
jgi:hypothetical protein